MLRNDCRVPRAAAVLDGDAADPRRELYQRVANAQRVPGDFAAGRYVAGIVVIV